MIRHRPPEELLLGYAAGTLPEPLALVIAAHAALCPESAEEILRLESVGGGLLAGIDPAALESGALERTLAALEHGDRPAPAALSPTPETRALLPPPVWPYVKGNLLSVQWRRRGFHIETAPLVADGAHRTAFLLRVTGGHPVPHHTHKGAELTLVLAGAYSDAGVSYSPGDIQVADPTIDHRPVAKPGEDCICIVALEAPLRFTGPIGRFANPFVKL